MYSYNYGGLDSALIRSILIFSACMILLGLLTRVLFALAVNSDAKAIGVKNNILWSVLMFFFPLIVGIVYLCSRNSLDKTVPRYCTSCGSAMPPNTKVCYNCSSTALLDYKINGSEKNKKLRKAFLIGAIVLYVLTFIFAQVFGVKLVSDIYKMINSQSNNGGYEDYFNDYFDNFGKYFEQYGQEENPADDSNDFFDDFNNFGQGEEGENDETPQLPDTDPFDFFDDFGD